MSLIKNTFSFAIFFLISACGGGSSASNDGQEESPNQPPTISFPSDINHDELVHVKISPQVTDIDGSIRTYEWSQISGAEVNIENLKLKDLEFIAPQVSTDEELSFKLTTIDDTNSSTSKTVSIFIKNKPPIIESEHPLLAHEGEKVVLKAITIDEGNGELRHEWNQTSGITVDLIDSKSANTSFIASSVSQDEVLSFELKTTDKDGDIATSTTEIKIQNLIRLINIPVSVSISEAKEQEISNLQNTSIVQEEKKTVFKTLATLSYGDTSKELELTKIDDNQWIGNFEDVPTDTEILLETKSEDFAHNVIYEQHAEHKFLESDENNEVSSILEKVEESETTHEPIDECTVYTDKDGAIFELEFSEKVNDDGRIVIHVGYRNDGEYIWHNHCGPAYTEYYPSGLKFRESYYLEDVEYNNGDISYISYHDNIGFDDKQAKREINRRDENGDYFLLNDEPSKINYHESGRVFYKTWYVGEKFGRKFGPDQIHYADVDGNHYTNMWWYNLDQMKTKRKDFHADGSAENCIYFDDKGEYEVVDGECLNELALDEQYNINGNIEPADLCENYLDSDGTVYPITTQENQGYVTTGYTKGGQYIYHNQCDVAMTRFYESGNPKHSWIFINGVNTNPNGATSISYFDMLNKHGESIKRMESKIEDGYYVIENDKPSVIKYFTNGDVQYRSWMKTTDDGDWVYGRDIGPDVVNYSYGNDGYQRKDLYWYNESGTLLKRKYYDDNKEADFCHYYNELGEKDSDDACLNEEAKDMEYSIN